MPRPNKLSGEGVNLV